jgi:hypothetical protein
LLRDGRKISVFDHKAETSFGVGGGFVLLSASIIDNSWNSWDMQFGYGGMGLARYNDYDRHSLKDDTAFTEVRGWYFHIRKLILFDLRKQRSVDSEPERE